MKEIVKTLPKSAVITEKQVPEQPTIGFIVPNRKGWLQCRADEGKYVAMCAENGVSTGNYWHVPVATVAGFFKWLRTIKDTQAFLFESEKELFKWLSE